VEWSIQLMAHPANQADQEKSRHLC
jgi:hypothetical protein